MATTRGDKATDGPVVTALGAFAVMALTHVDESGIHTFGPFPPALSAAVAGAGWAVTAYVAQAPAVVARSAAFWTAGRSGPATATETAVLLAHAVRTDALVVAVVPGAAAGAESPPDLEIAHHVPPPPATRTANATRGTTQRGLAGGASVW